MALIDSRIRVWWTEEKAWYAGRVVSIERGAGGNLNTTVAYDDGSTETHDLGVEAWEAWEAEPAPKCKTPTGRYGAATAAAVAGGKHTAAAHRQAHSKITRSVSAAAAAAGTVLTSPLASAEPESNGSPSEAIV